MNTYEHFFWNYAFFYRKTWAWKVGVGGLFPDLIYMVAFLPKVFFYRSFMEWMYDPLWDTLWESTLAKSVHSLAVWSLFLVILLAIHKKKISRQTMPFLIGWGIHIGFDALTHVSDGYALFYPLSNFRFPAPVSYWEKAYHAREFFWISHILMAGLLLLWLGWKLKRILRRKSR